ncbi:hypothetical protein EXE46_06075 [Halorubrum sp. GN11_10-6_MGM]|nr:hypothetical protein EXE46_06075 [Halorubrum sp. GN11_10-6_MGM]
MLQSQRRLRVPYKPTRRLPTSSASEVRDLMTDVDKPDSEADEGSRRGVYLTRHRVDMERAGRTPHDAGEDGPRAERDGDPCGLSSRWWVVELVGCLRRAVFEQESRPSPRSDWVGRSWHFVIVGERAEGLLPVARFSFERVRQVVVLVSSDVALRRDTVEGD